MPASEIDVNLTSVNQLDDGGKTRVTNLEMFWEQSFKWRHSRCLRDVTIPQPTDREVVR